VKPDNPCGRSLEVRLEEFWESRVTKFPKLTPVYLTRDHEGRPMLSVMGGELVAYFRQGVSLAEFRQSVFKTYEGIVRGRR